MIILDHRTLAYLKKGNDLLTLLAWLCGSAVGGLVGNRADWVSCNAIKQISSTFERPENHDIAKNLLQSLFRSLKDFLADLRASNPFPNIEDTILDCENSLDWLSDDIGKPPGAGTKAIIETLHDELAPFLDFAQSTERQKKRQDVENAISKGVLKWLSQRVGFNSLPDAFVAVFKNGGFFNGKRVQPWIQLYRNQLGAVIKENESRFREILNTELTAGIHEMSRDVFDKTSSIESQLAYLTEAHDSMAWDEVLFDRSIPCEIRLRGSNSFDAAEPMSLRRLNVRLGQGFKLRIDNHNEGSNCFVLQEINGQWHTTTLNANHDKVVVAPPEPFEILEDDWLCEYDESHLGKRRIATVILDKKLLDSINRILQIREVLAPSELNMLANLVTQAISTNDAAICLLQCYFVR